jgi:hypothetical protein
VFENRVLRGIFEPERDEVTGGWRKQHNEEFRDLYSSPNIIRMMESRRIRWAGHVVDYEWKRGMLLLVIGGKARGKDTTRRPRRRWVDNIRMDLGEVGWGAVDWIGLAQDRNRCRALVNVTMNL